ncbi:undecaprenyl-diphosphatase UppP [Methanobrevibacter sp. DSM 116169]|uniref:undecaprenyl-diphosphatase UppP n=1 Tax=Methanobrevibacter sp. DSM 116169 TaxID=3242727 RepID=UPI0038FC23F7
MDIFSAIIIGIIQGLTEFLPISSSAHLIFFQELLGVSQSNLSFEILLHLGTLIAVIAYFIKDIIKLIEAFFLSILDIFSGKFKKGLNINPYKKLAWLIIIASIPTGIIGFLFKDIFEGMFQSVTIPAVFLIVTGVLLYLSQRINIGNRNINDINSKDALIIGITQGLAIIPGISRSGSTLSTGLFLGLNKEFAAKFSFILSIPAIIGANLFEFKNITAALDITYLCGFIAAIIVGYLTISILLEIIKKKKLDIFAYYCWIVGIAILILSTFT